MRLPLEPGRSSGRGRSFDRSLRLSLGSVWARSMAVILGAGLLLGVAAGCRHPHETEDQRLQRQTAEQTRQLREDARTAGVLARQEVSKAGRQARDIVAGVRQGWRDGAPPPKSPGSGAKVAGGSVVDLNTASADRLGTLPGVSPALARKIIKHRPYDAPEDLVTRDFLSQAQFDRIAGRLVAR